MDYHKPTEASLGEAPIPTSSWPVPEPSGWDIRQGPVGGN